MKKTSVLTALVVLAIIAGIWVHYYGFPNIAYNHKSGNSGSELNPKANSTSSVNYREVNGLSVRILYAGKVRGIRTVESVTQAYTSYMYLYPSDGYIGYLFKVNVTNTGKSPVSIKFYLVTREGKKVSSMDHTVYAVYTRVTNGPAPQGTAVTNIVPMDVLCNAVRIPVKFSNDEISYLGANASLNVFLYYSVELGDKPVSLYVDVSNLNGGHFDFTVPISLER